MMLIGFLPLLFVFFFLAPRILRQDGRAEERTGRAVPPGGDAEPGPSLESRVYRLAGRLHGRLTLSDVVIETGLPVKQAEELLDSMVDGLRVQLELTDDGLAVYGFPEVAHRFERQKHAMPPEPQ